MNKIDKFEKDYGLKPLDYVIDQLYSIITRLFSKQLLYWAVLRSWEITSENESDHPDFDTITLDTVCQHLDKHNIKGDTVPKTAIDSIH